MPELPEEMVLPAGTVPEVPDGGPAVPRDAATVALLRDAAAGMEVFLLRRATGMAFAGGMSVFPGGGVDPRDSDASVAWSGPEPAWWARRFGCGPDLARALVCAAVRETFEESGVLLAGPDARTVVGDAGRYAPGRAALAARELSLAQFLQDNRLVLRADLLRPWSNWLTPVGEPRRYDTWFFLAVLPEGQAADGATSEASAAHWHRPEQALADWRSHEVALLPPTWMTLAELAGAGTVAAALATGRTIDKLVPRVVRDGGQVRVVLPGDPRYDAAPNHLEP